MQPTQFQFQNVAGNASRSDSGNKPGAYECVQLVECSVLFRSSQLTIVALCIAERQKSADLMSYTVSAPSGRQTAFPEEDGTLMGNYFS